MERFYRIEHREYRNGPYSGSSKVYAVLAGHTDEAHPNPFKEGLWTWDTVNRYMERCGFGSLEAMLAWFSVENLQDIYNCDHNYVFAVYEGESEYIRHGKYQSVAFISKLMLIEELPLNEFLTTLSERGTIAS
jgi:hypothetical protein